MFRILDDEDLFPARPPPPLPPVRTCHGREGSVAASVSEPPASRPAPSPPPPPPRPPPPAVVSLVATPLKVGTILVPSRTKKAAKADAPAPTVSVPLTSLTLFLDPALAVARPGSRRWALSLWVESPPGPPCAETLFPFKVLFSRRRREHLPPASTHADVDRADDGPPFEEEAAAGGQNRFEEVDEFRLESSGRLTRRFVVLPVAAEGVEKDGPWEIHLDGPGTLQSAALILDDGDDDDVDQRP